MQCESEFLFSGWCTYFTPQYAVPTQTEIKITKIVYPYWPNKDKQCFLNNVWIYKIKKTYSPCSFSQKQQPSQNFTNHYHKFCQSSLYFNYTSLYFSSSLSLFCLPLCIINLHPICHEIPHLLDTQKGRLCLFFIWTVGDGARCLAAAECSGVTVPVTGPDEQPQMKDEAWRILGRGAPHDLVPQEYPPLM